MINPDKQNSVGAISAEASPSSLAQPPRNNPHSLAPPFPKQPETHVLNSCFRRRKRRELGPSKSVDIISPSILGDLRFKPKRRVCADQWCAVFEVRCQASQHSGEPVRLVRSCNAHAARHWICENLWINMGSLRWCAVMQGRGWEAGLIESFLRGEFEDTLLWGSRV
jgi:hypothetical protein